MLDYDVGAIVPSTRDLLQVLSTRRRSIAIAALVLDHVESEAARLDEIGVSAFAYLDAGPPMMLGARATKTIPALCLAGARDKESCLRARYFGADGLCIDGALDLDAWDAVAKQVRTTRMLPIALATDKATVDAAVTAGARAIVLRAANAEPFPEIAASLPKNVTLIAYLESTDHADFKALLGHADAAIVPPTIHATKDFASLVAALDP